tara:strand:- start:242 stop:619 length:378 start_codon:yes stop_codon:yes gene_type:complete
MKEIKTKKQTIINTHQVSMIAYIEDELIKRHNKKEPNKGYVKSIKFTSKREDSALINKAELIYSIRVEINNNSIGMINYHYEVIPSGDISYLCIPSFEENNFKLINENEELFINNIEKLNEQLTA